MFLACSGGRGSEDLAGKALSSGYLSKQSSTKAGRSTPSSHASHSIKRRARRTRTKMQWYGRSILV